MDSTCCGGVCGRCWAAKYIVVGVVVVLTAQYWAKYIWHVLGALLILKGILKLAMPNGCGHCAPEMKKGKK